MRPTIAKLRKTLPQFLTIKQYCTLKDCCRASAYNDLRRIAGLGVKLGPNTFIVRDVALDEMARAEEPIPWVPQEKRTSTPENPPNPRKREDSAPCVSSTWRRSHESSPQNLTCRARGYGHERR
jgi:hypothetical protein